MKEIFDWGFCERDRQFLDLIRDVERVGVIYTAMLLKIPKKCFLSCASMALTKKMRH